MHEAYVPNAWKVADDGDVELTKEIGITDTRALQDLRGTESSGAQDDHLTGLDNGLGELGVVGAVARRNIGDTDGLLVLVEENAVDASIGAEVEVALDIHDGVDVCCSCRSVCVIVMCRKSSGRTSSSVATPASMPVDVLGPDFSTMSSVKI